MRLVSTEKRLVTLFVCKKKELRIKRSHLSRDNLDRYGYNSILTKLPKLLNETSVGLTIELIITNKCEYIQKVKK